MSIINVGWLRLCGIAGITGNRSSFSCLHRYSVGWLRGRRLDHQRWAFKGTNYFMVCCITIGVVTCVWHIRHWFIYHQSSYEIDRGTVLQLTVPWKITHATLQYIPYWFNPVTFNPSLPICRSQRLHTSALSISLLTQPYCNIYTIHVNTAIFCESFESLRQVVGHNYMYITR